MKKLLDFYFFNEFIIRSLVCYRLVHCKNECFFKKIDIVNT